MDMLITFFNYQLYTVGLFVTNIYRRKASVLKILSRAK